MDLNNIVEKKYGTLPLPIKENIEKILHKLPIEQLIEKVPTLKKLVDEKYDEIISTAVQKNKPYTNTFETYKSLPTKGLAKGKVLETMKKMSREESQSWKNGFVSGTVYHGNEEHINLNEVYSIHSQTNPIHSDIYLNQ